jgi:hypothetical protein
MGDKKVEHRESAKDLHMRVDACCGAGCERLPAGLGRRRLEVIDAAHLQGLVALPEEGAIRPFSGI